MLHELQSHTNAIPPILKPFLSFLPCVYIFLPDTLTPRVADMQRQLPSTMQTDEAVERRYF